MPRSIDEEQLPEHAVLYSFGTAINNKKTSIKQERQAKTGVKKRNSGVVVLNLV